MGPLIENQDDLAARFARFGVMNSSMRTEIYSPAESNKMQQQTQKAASKSLVKHKISLEKPKS
jgi:hypothetical protein